MTISRNELLQTLKSLSLTNEGAAYVLRNYDAMAPSRKGTGLFGHVHDTYASYKNRFTTNSESRHCEAPFLLWCELGSSIIIYLDQPEAIKLRYLKNGRTVTHLATPDFLVIEASEAYLVECKPVDKLERLIEKYPEKYSKTKQGYSCPPAVESARRLGLGHKVITDRDFSVCFTRNCYYLLQFAPKQEQLEEGMINELKNYIRRHDNRCRLSELSNTFGQRAIFSAILSNQLFFDINTELVVYPDRVWIYAEHQYIQAVLELRLDKTLAPVHQLSQLVNEPVVCWGKEEWQIISVNSSPENALTLLTTGKMVTLTRQEFYQLVHGGELMLPCDDVDAPLSAATKQICQTSARQFDAANQKLKLISTLPNPDLPERTRYRYMANYKEAKEKFGDGLIGLIDKSHLRGNRKPRLSQEVISLLEKHFKNAVKPSSGPLKYYFDKYVEESEELSLPTCSMRTFYQRFNQFAPEPRKTLLQKGPRAAYQLGPQPLPISLDTTIPYQGDHAFQIGHIDHSPIEITFVSKLNGEPIKGTMNLSILYDGYSRKILAFYVTFEKPSYRATMMLLRECYRLYGTLPLMLVFDRGADFESKYLDSTLASLGIHKRRRPVGYSRHGSGIERSFGISETELIHHLDGNRQLQKLGRSLSSSHKPAKHAAWTPDDFFIALKDYVYLYHPETMRAGIAETPEQRFRRSMASFDELPGVQASSETQFYLATLPLGRNDGYYTLNKNQIKFNHVLYRLTKPVEGYNGRKLKVLLKYDPYDIRFVWARVKNQWVQLNTVDTLVRECYDQGIQHAHLEVFGRSTTQIKAYQSGKARPIPKTFLQTDEKAIFSQTRATEHSNPEGLKIPPAVEIDLSKLSPFEATREEA